MSRTPIRSKKRSTEGQTCNVIVGVRVRPLCVGVDGIRDSARDDPAKRVCVKVKQKAISLVDRRRAKPAAQQFNYDHTYDTSATQEEIFEDLGSILLRQTLRGYNACLFAYGQTGSGKTYSMFGPPGWGSLSADPTERGLVPRFTSALFSTLETQAGVNASNATEGTPPNSPSVSDASPMSTGTSPHPQKEQRPYRVEVAVYEIYNERVYDLLLTEDGGKFPRSGSSAQLPRSASSMQLATSMMTYRVETAASLDAPAGPILQNSSTREEKSALLMQAAAQNSKEESFRVREHPEKGPYVDGLSKWNVGSNDDITALVKRGVRHRHTAATLCNDRSSRSHLIVEMNIITSKFEKTEQDVTELSSKVNLVDLAGSERCSHAGTEGERLREGSSINKSLLALGNVIEGLASASTFVQYRDSAITWLLKEALGGNSRTVMLATVSPHTTYYDESFATLTYADRAKKIQNVAKINKSTRRRLINELRREISALKKELHEGVTPRSARPSTPLLENFATFVSPSHSIGLPTPPAARHLFSVEWSHTAFLGIPDVQQVSLIEGGLYELQQMLAEGDATVNHALWSPKGRVLAEEVATLPQFLEMLKTRFGEETQLLHTAGLLHTNTTLDVSKLNVRHTPNTPETAIWLHSEASPQTMLGVLVRVDEREGNEVVTRLALYIRNGVVWERSADSAAHAQAVRAVADRVARTLDTHRLYAALLATQPQEVVRALSRSLPSLSTVNAMDPPVAAPTTPRRIQIALLEGEEEVLTPLRWDAAVEKWKAHGAGKAATAGAVEALLLLVDDVRGELGYGPMGQGIRRLSDVGRIDAVGGLEGEGHSSQHREVAGSPYSQQSRAKAGGRGLQSDPSSNGLTTGSHPEVADSNADHEEDFLTTGPDAKKKCKLVCPIFIRNSISKKKKSQLQVELDRLNIRFDKKDGDSSQHIARLEASHAAEREEGAARLAQLEANLGRLSVQYTDALRQLAAHATAEKARQDETERIASLEDALESMTRAHTRSEANALRLQEEGDKLRTLLRTPHTPMAHPAEEGEAERLRQELDDEARRRRHQEDKVAALLAEKKSANYHLRQERDRNSDLKRRADDYETRCDQACTQERLAKEELKKAHDQLHYLRIERDGGERAATSTLDLSIQVQLLGEDKTRLESLLDASRRELRDTIMTSHAKMKEDLVHYKARSDEFEARYKSAEAKSLDHRLRADREKDARLRKDAELQGLRDEYVFITGRKPPKTVQAAPTCNAYSRTPSCTRQARTKVTRQAVCHFYFALNEKRESNARWADCIKT